MNSHKSSQVVIDGIEYDSSTFSDQQKALLNHTVDLERKVATAKFDFDQLQVSRDAFLNMLKNSLATSAKVKSE